METNNSKRGVMEDLTFDDGEWKRCIQIRPESMDDDEKDEQSSQQWKCRGHFGK